MDLTTILTQVIGGLVGGNAAGAASKNISLGPLGNSVAGAIGGGLGGQLLNILLDIGQTAASGGIDFSAIIQGFTTGGISGAVTAFLIGYLKSKFTGWMEYKRLVEPLVPASICQNAIVNKIQFACTKNTCYGLLRATARSTSLIWPGMQGQASIRLSASVRATSRCLAMSSPRVMGHFDVEFPKRADAC